MEIVSPNLTSIVMPRNKEMHTLRLQCPALTYLDIRACMVLRELHLDTPALTSLKMEYCPEFAFVCLPPDLLKRLQPNRGIRTDRGGEEASVRHTSLMRPELCSAVTSGSESKVEEATRDTRVDAASSHDSHLSTGVETTTMATPECDYDVPPASPQSEGSDRVPSILWRLQRLRESLADIALDESSRAGIQRQIERQSKLLAALQSDTIGLGDNSNKK
jgi:hypothetical protein